MGQSKHHSTAKETKLINTNFLRFNWLNVPVIGTLVVNVNCYAYAISSHYALSFVFSNGKTGKVFPVFKLNALIK